MVALGVIALGVWAFIEAVEAEPATVGSIGTVVGGFVGLQWQQRRVERDKLQQARREEIAPTYRNLIQYIREAAERGGGEGEKLTAKDRKFFADFQDKLLLWGPASVVEAWASGMRTAEDPEAGMDSVLAYVKILAAIREDLGHDDKGLAVRDLLRAFINDADKHVGPNVRL